MHYFERRIWWFALITVSLLFELAALYFQYILELDPCVLCVYERTAVMGLMVAGWIGFINPSTGLLRFVGYGLWGSATVWGLYLALKHSGLQLGIIDPSLSCDFNANYYSWFKLDQWLPVVFEPTGYCDEIQWSFFGLSMPQVMIGVYLGYLGALLYTLYKELKRFKSTHF